MKKKTQRLGREGAPHGVAREKTSKQMLGKRRPSSRRGARPKQRQSPPAFLAVDFFCGAGGTTCGLIDAGGYVIAGVDNDCRCEETYTKNNANSSLDRQTPRFLSRDIFPSRRNYPGGEQKVLFAELDVLVEKARKRAPRSPLLFAICAPCQPFTKLARKELSEKRKAKREKDSNLLAEAVKFVARFKPDMVLSENVQGIADPKYGGVWKSFKTKLKKLGYVVGDDVVCASRFGIPQHRKRSILLAVRRERLAASDLVQLEVPQRDPKAATVSVKQAIAGLPAIKAGCYDAEDPNHRARTLSETNIKRLRAAQPGRSNAYMDMARGKTLALACHRKVNKRLGIRCFTDVYTRMHPDRPSPTITTKCHSISNGRFGYFDMKQDRGISLREAALLQSFPHGYMFFPTHQIEPIARMIGNAVPPRLAAFYSRYLTGLVKRRRARR